LGAGPIWYVGGMPVVAYWVDQRSGTKHEPMVLSCTLGSPSLLSRIG
jgi:hypothetical protein